jgi:hypothetical protein
MIPVYEDEQVINKHVKRSYWYRQVEPGDRYRKGLNLLLDILERLLRAKDYHDCQENEDRNIDKLGNHGLVFGVEGSEEVLHRKVGFPFGRKAATLAPRRMIQTFRYRRISSVQPRLLIHGTYRKTTSVKHATMMMLKKTTIMTFRKASIIR